MGNAREPYHLVRRQSKIHGMGASKGPQAPDARQRDRFTWGPRRAPKPPTLGSATAKPWRSSIYAAAAIASAAARAASSMSPFVCARETKAASNCEGASDI